MPDETRHESTDVDDLEVRDTYDTLDGDVGEDPLDTGVITPERWSSAIRYGTTAEEEEERGESLDQLLAEEEPDPALDYEDEDDEEESEDLAGDDEAGDEDVDGLLLDD